MKRKLLRSTCVAAGFLLFSTGKIAGQNYMADFLQYQQKADSMITALVKGIDEVGLRILVERTPQSLKEIFYSSYKEICFVNGLPVSKKKQPRNFLSPQKIRSLVGAKAKTDLSKNVCELAWDTQKKGSVCYGRYYYKVVYVRNEAGRNYVYDLKVDPASGKILSTSREEAEIGEIDVSFRRVDQ